MTQPTEVAQSVIEVSNATSKAIIALMGQEHVEGRLAMENAGIPAFRMLETAVEPTITSRPTTGNQTRAAANTLRRREHFARRRPRAPRCWSRPCCRNTAKVLLRWNRRPSLRLPYSAAQTMVARTPTEALLCSPNRSVSRAMRRSIAGPRTQKRRRRVALNITNAPLVRNAAAYHDIIEVVQNGT